MDYLFNKITGESRPLPPLPEDADADYGACGLATRYRKKHVNFYPRRKPADLLVTLVIVVVTVVAFGGEGDNNFNTWAFHRAQSHVWSRRRVTPHSEIIGGIEGLVQVL